MSSSEGKQSVNPEHAEAVNKLVKSLRGADFSPFHLSDGSVIRSVDDLKKRLKTMPADVFHHHVTDNRNDFATWITDVFHDADLASQARKARTPLQMAHLLSSRSKNVDDAQQRLFSHAKDYLQALKHERSSSEHLVKKLAARIQYLAQQEHHVSNLLTSIDENPNTVVVHSTDSYDDYLLEIHSVKAMIESGDLTEAKEAYLSLRHKFSNEHSLPIRDVKRIQNLLQGLYSDLNLKLLHP